MLKIIFTLFLVYCAIGIFLYVNKGSYKIYASWGNPLQVFTVGFITMLTWPFKDWRDPSEKR